MTGFGLASKDHNNTKFVVEIKSLNSKFLELGLRLPKAYSDKELLLRNICSKDIERGKVNVNITIDSEEQGAKGATINTALLTRYYKELAAINATLGGKEENLLQAALNLPEVISFNDDTKEAADWDFLHQTFLEALDSFNEFRLTEGRELQADLELRISNLLAFFAEIEKLAPLRVPAIRERLTQMLDEYAGKVNIDNNRLEQELIYYIDKLDITEEKIRLQSHCAYFLDTLNSADANGKKLGFIAQEIGREVNTMGSKANDAKIQQLVVGMKEELEKIKEQLLNIL